MIDLREDEFKLSLYAKRYAQLAPKPSRQLQCRKEYNTTHPEWVQEDTKIDVGKPDWLRNQPQVVPDSIALDKAKGALVGLAIGDAVGTTLEFSSRDHVYINDMVGGGPFQLKAGEWTDDTSMALCLAETYLDAGWLDLDLFRKKLVRWYHYGENSSNGRCFGIGNTTRYALDAYLKNGSQWFGNTGGETAGGAAIIRHAPVAIFRRKSFLRIWTESKSQSIATHGSAESINSCQFLGLILHFLLNGHSKEVTFSPHVFSSTLRVLLINAGEYKEKNRDQIRSSGYVIDTLEAAMWSVWNTDNFRDAILLAANLGDDADSVAATTGQIAGALYGYSGIPSEWLAKLVQQERIASIAENLFKRAPVDD
ncbi:MULTISPECIES: ADP-ribosylarginine hydrolase Tri1 [unclassified Brenneria]|uniref:ADP-ribosylarginine hydrolase Tri1 n=1 Tax=unclassified Brenneria TaxID=2634434 RepID=UPI0029C22A6F|nr:MULTISPECIES: ADP-ribosylarginine hydrolase Tri1 [unclassified Brenneria]MDX5629087.1 ADP-ribosylarginine hydrolase Tri1 [Brenneria sp. L3-3Z]MDX5696226.1 ADP-ribosylarginine hydrolase Tri1 [Brenneria sp. L4-2C]